MPENKRIENNNLIKLHNFRVYLHKKKIIKKICDKQALKITIYQENSFIIYESTTSMDLQSA